MRPWLKNSHIGVKVLDENEFDPKLSVCEDRISRIVLAKSVNELNIDTKPNRHSPTDTQKTMFSL